MGKYYGTKHIFNHLKIVFTGPLEENEIIRDDVNYISEELKGEY